MIRRIEKPSELVNPAQESRKSWVNILFLSLTPVIGLFGTAAYGIAFGVRWWEPVLFVLLFGLVSFSVTGGYHRCFAHRAYVCHPAVQAFYRFFGAMALQNSALKWSSDHRDHHRYADRDWDPYGIQRGGLWAHILWLFYTEPPERTYDNVPEWERPAARQPAQSSGQQWQVPSAQSREPPSEASLEPRPDTRPVRLSIRGRNRSESIRPMEVVPWGRPP